MEEEFLAFLEELRDNWQDLQMFAMRDFWAGQLRYWREPEAADAKARAAALRAERAAQMARARLQRRSLHPDEVELDLLQLEPYLDFMPDGGVTGQAVVKGEEGEESEEAEDTTPPGATQTDAQRLEADAAGYALEDREYNMAMQAALAEALLGDDAKLTGDPTALLTTDTPLERKKRAMASFSKSPKALKWLKDSQARLMKAKEKRYNDPTAPNAADAMRRADEMDPSELEVAVNGEGEEMNDWGVPIFDTSRIESLLGEGLGRVDATTSDHDAFWNFEFMWRVDPLLRYYQTGWGLFSSRTIAKKQLRAIHDALPGVNPVEVVLNDPWAMSFEPEHDPRQRMPVAQVPLLREVLKGADVDAMIYRHGSLLAAYVEEIAANLEELKSMLAEEDAMRMVTALPQLLTVGLDGLAREVCLESLSSALAAGAEVGLHPSRVCDMCRHNPSIMLANEDPNYPAAVVRWVNMLPEKPAAGNGEWYTYGVMPIIAFNDPKEVQRYHFLHEKHPEQEEVTFGRVMEPTEEEFVGLFPDYPEWCTGNGVGPGHVEWGPGTHPFEGEIVDFVTDEELERLVSDGEYGKVEEGEGFKQLQDIPRGGLTAFSRNKTTGVPWKPYE